MSKFTANIIITLACPTLLLAILMCIGVVGKTDFLLFLVNWGFTIIAGIAMGTALNVITTKENK